MRTEQIILEDGTQSVSLATHSHLTQLVLNRVSHELYIINMIQEGVEILHCTQAGAPLIGRVAGRSPGGSSHLHPSITLVVGYSVISSHITTIIVARKRTIGGCQKTCSKIRIGIYLIEILEVFHCWREYIIASREQGCRCKYHDYISYFHHFIF